MSKKVLSERDICTKFITPAVEKAGCDLMPQVREEVSFTNRQILVRGKRVKRGVTKRADYMLYYASNLPIAIIEAKDNNHSVGSGMQQALEYGDMLDIPLIFSSNGDITKFMISFPLLEEQKRIVAKVDALMAYCDTLEKPLTKQQNTAEQLASAMVNSLAA